MRRIRVAHVITRLCKGGAQENTFHTVRLANRDRFDVDLISGFTSGSEGAIEPSIRAAGIEIVREPMLVRPVSPLRDLLAVRNLTGLFRERKYDIVHTHTSKAGYVGRLAAERARVPIVVHTPHGHVFHGYFGPLMTRLFIHLERRAAFRTSRLIALTERGIEEHLAENIGRPEQWIAVFSGIDLAPFEEARRKRSETRRALGIAPDNVLVGAVGRLEPVKGFTYFVEAARIIARHSPSARFVHAGDGSLRAEIEAAARPLGDTFRFLGLRDDVPDLMAAMDVFVLPSLNEGMGRVLLECGAAGVPAVATAVGGVPDVLKDGETGVLAPPRDPQAIADAVLGMIHDPGYRLRLGNQARAHVVPAFGLERMVVRIEQLYEELIAEHGLHA